MSGMQDAFKRWIMLQPSHKTERLVAFEAGYQAAIADVKAGVDNRGGPGLGDDVPCSKCRAVALDTGLECTECGHDMRPEIDGQTISALRDVADAVCKQFAAAGIAPVIGSPNPAEDLHARAVIALGGKVEHEHIASSACWCQPDTDYVDPVTGVVVYVHRQVQ